MTTPDSLLDLNQLLTPIAGDNPCGESLRWDTKWDELSQLRKSRKDPLDSSGDKEPEWDRLVTLATDLLETRTKDLLIAGWLTEALVKTKGFAGLRDGLKLVQGLVERFWDGIHPLPDEQDFTNRAAPLIWLAQSDGGARMSAMVREIPLMARPDGPTLHWNFWHLRRAAPQGTGEKEDAFKRRSAEAEQFRQTFDSAVETASLKSFQVLLADLDACLVETQKLATLLDSRLPSELSPDWGKLREEIGGIRVFIYGVLKRRGGLPAEPVSEIAASGEQSVETNQANANGQDQQRGPIRTRAGAMSQLEEAAKFFSETEPHSPVAYLVRRAIRWASMPFEDVLAELVKDDKLVKQISETLGIVSAPSK